MAVDKLVDSNQLNADLTSVANAIRTKGGTSDPLAFPNGFVSAVNSIPTGGSSDNGNFILYCSEEYDKDVQDTVLKFDKTYDELSAAILAGKNVFVIEDDGTHNGYGDKYELCFANSGEADFTHIYHNQVTTLIYMNNGTRAAQRESTTLVIDTSSGN